ncbi:MAG: ABC transporter substrate-binding protein [Campylobacterota bacterium]
MLSQYFRYMFLLTLSLSALTFSGCSNKESGEELHVGMNTWPGYEPFVLAKDLGYLDERVRVSRLDSATNVIRSFKSDLIDVACITLDEAIIMQETSEDEIKVITIMDFSTGGDVIIANKNIKSLKELKGKRIGVESTALGAFMLARAVDFTPELTMSDLKILNIGYEHHQNDFETNKIDAVITFEPIKTRLLKSTNAHVIFSSEQIPGEILDVIVVKSKTIKSKNSELQKMIDAWYETIEYIKQNRNESLKRMAKYENISLNEFAIAYTGLTVPSLVENRMFFKLKLKDSIKKIRNTLLNKQLIQKEFNEKDLYSAEFLGSET